MREDMRKLDRLDEQTRFLAENSIETHEDIDRYRSDATDELSALKVERDDLRNKLKRVIRSGDEAAVLEVKQQIAAVSNRIKKIKANFKTCDSVVERATRIREQLEELYNEQPERKENSDELFRRRGGTSRKDVPKRR
jgi:predicted phage-related endonuclease